MNVNDELTKLEAEHEEYLQNISELMDYGLSGIGATGIAKKKIDKISEKDDKIIARIEMLKKSEKEKLDDLDRIEESKNELKRRLSEIYEVQEDEFGVYYVDYNLPHTVLPKKQFSRDEILADIDRIEVSSTKTLTVRFKTFTEVEKIVERHKEIMTDRTLAIFEEVKADGWNRVFYYYSNSFWLR